MKRVISFILVLVMLIGVMPIPAGAEEVQETTTLLETTAESVPEEVTEASTEPTATSEAVEGTQSQETVETQPQETVETQPQVTEETQPSEPVETEPEAPEILSWEEYRYTLLPDGTVSICGFTGTLEDADKPFLVVIPDAIQGVVVTQIAEKAFAGNEAINAVLLSETIQVIGSGAFEDCKNLRVLAFCGDAPSFGETFVKGCDKLEEIYVLENRDFSALEELLGEDLGQEEARKIQFQSFENETILVDFFSALGDDGSKDTQPPENNVPVGVTAATIIASGKCGKNLTWTLDEEGTLTISGKGRMDDYTDVEGADTPWNENLYDGITKIVIQEGVTSIGSFAFIFAERLTSVTIADSVTRIGKMAFYRCENLPSVTIPASVSAIGIGAFASCYSLTEIKVSETNCHFVSDESGAIYDREKTILFAVPAGLTGSYNIAPGVETICAHAFEGCSQLIHILIPNGVTYIGDNSFDSCTSLTNVILPNGITNIGKDAFAWCESLTSIAIPNSVTYLGNGALSNCTSLTSVTLPDGMTNIEACVFWWCKSLTSIVIPDGVTSIGDSAFWSCESLTSINIPDGVTSIQDSAFSWCESLTNITIPDGVTSIGESAFLGCDSLVSINIPASVTSIGYGAFEFCDNLVSIDIPRGITVIPGGFVSRCKSLTTFHIPSGVTTIGNSAFSGCESLTAITIPPKVTSIGKWTFEGCKNLTSITIPKGVTAIGKYAFFGCSKLRNIYYGGSAEQWNKITVDSGNSVLSQISVNYNSAGPDWGYVYLFSKWDAANKIAYFGPGDMLGCEVTSETDASFARNPTAYLGKLLLVEKKPRTDGIIIGPDILLSVKVVETSIGTVTYADEEAVKIDGKTYDTPNTMTQPRDYIGERVVYHLYNGALVEAEILETLEGTLVSWNRESRELQVNLDGSAKNPVVYTLSPLADDRTESYLDSGDNINLQIRYLLGDHNIVYRIENFGFSPYRDGWSFANHYEGFGYKNPYRIPEERYETVFGKSYVASAKASSGKIFESMMPKWNGNCYGMSVTSILFYLDFLNWENYRNPNSDTINSYYSSVENGGLLDLLKVHAVSEKNTRITELIESYQVLQCGTDCGYRYIDSTYSDPLNGYEIKQRTDAGDDFYSHDPNGHYIEELVNRLINSDIPLVLDMHFGTGKFKQGGHSVVLRTDKKPQQMPDGTWRVYVYDPNYPCFPEAIDPGWGKSPADYYSNQQDLYIEFRGNQWRYLGRINGSSPSHYWGSNKNWEVKYWGAGNIERYAPEYIFAWSIQNVGMPLQFDGSESWLPSYQNQPGFVYAPGSSVDIFLPDGNRIASIANGVPVYLAEGVIFDRSMGGTVDGEEGGRLTLPNEEFIVEYKEGNDISILGIENVINVAPTGNVILNVSTANGKLEVDSTENVDVVVQISNIYGNDSYSSVVAGGSLKTGDMAVLSLSGDKFTASLTGEGILEITTDCEDAPVSEYVTTVQESSGEVVIDDIRNAPILPSFSVQIEQEYITLSLGEQTRLTVNITPGEYLDSIGWSTEDAQKILNVDPDGTITAKKTGTAYVIAAITIDGVTYSDRCRVDVTAQESSVAVQGAQLGTTALTTELFKTDYASFDVILLLKQNESRIMTADAISPDGAAPEDNGIAISSARFEDEQMDALFALAVKDDRTLLVVPRQTAVDNPNTVGMSYSSKVIVNVGGEEFTTASSLKLTIKKTMPKLKAASLSFNSFYTNQAQPIVITGATVTGISRNTTKDTAKTAALPNWLTLSDGVLTLTDDAPAKSASGSAYVLVETEEWAMPIAVTVPVKLAYKATGLKLSASSVTFANAGSGGVSLRLLCSRKADTLSALNVSGIRAPEGFDVRNFNRVDGSFTLVPNGATAPGYKSLVVSFGDTDKTMELKLLVFTRAVTLSAKPGTITLNSVVGDSAVVQLTASPVDYQITKPTLRLTDIRGKAADGQLDLSYSNGTVTTKTNTKTQHGAMYRLYISTADSREIAVTIRTLAERSSNPALSARITGAIDLAFPESYAVVLPSFRNYNSGLCTLERWSVTESKGITNLGDATNSFDFGYTDGQYRILAKDNLTVGNTYMLTMTFSLADGSTYSCSVKIPVKRTAVKLKLSTTTLSLNKSVEDMVYLDLQCLTKGYDLNAPLISKPENLFVNYRDGRLFVAVNAKTEYGATYRVSVRATQYDAPVTLTVKIPAENKSAVTATLKAVGQLDVVRDSTAITVTPTYKNVLRAPNTYWQMDVYSSADNYATPVAGLFHVEKTESGSFAITRAEGAQINAKLKYRAVLTSKFVNVTVKSAPIALKVTAGSAKITAQAPGSTLYAVDKNSRADFRLIPGDSELNKILSVRLKNQSDRNLFELFDYGNGAYAIGFKNGEVDQSLMFGKTAISLPLEVILDGNGTPGAIVSTTLKVSFIPYSKITKLSIYGGIYDLTGKTTNLDAGCSRWLSVKTEPADALKQVTWTSSDPTVATVDSETGVVEAHKVGKTVIICTANDGSRKSASMTLNVTAPILVDLTIRQTFCLGDTLDARSLMLKASYQSGWSRQIVEGFTCTPSVLNEVGTQTVTVTYGGMKKNFQVEVLDFYELSAEVEDVCGEGYNEDGRVNWILYVTGRYTGNYTGFSFQTNLSVPYGTTTKLELDWNDALNGQGGGWDYSCIERGFGEYHGGHAFILPDNPMLAGRYSATLSFGDVTKTVYFTLVYNGNYTSGTGWSVTNVSWK